MFPWGKSLRGTRKFSEASLAMVGGLSILLGYKARYGALVLVAFLLPVTFRKTLADLAFVLFFAGLELLPTVGTQMFPLCLNRKSWRN